MGKTLPLKGPPPTTCTGAQPTFIYDILYMIYDTLYMIYDISFILLNVLSMVVGVWVTWLIPKFK